MTVLSTGAKVGILIAVTLAALGAYFVVVPINMPTPQGVFGCGSGLFPPTDPFAIGVCQQLPEIQQIKGAFSGAVALAIGIGSYVLFGVSRVPRPAETPELDPADPARI